MFIYGTAWKEERTAACVRHALDAGFRAFDTANQRKHYFEAGLGEAIAPWLAEGRRNALWLQTKYTFQRGQDHRLPYDPAAPIALQVRQSVQSSLKHLGVTRLDSVLLHGPATGGPLTADDREAWGALEALVDDGITATIGVSNVTHAQLAQFVEEARVPLTWVQNRCYARKAWDAETRAICAANDIGYQGFSLLTANRATWHHDNVASIARSRELTPSQVLYRYALDLGQTPLSGTTDPQHMAEALASRHADPLTPHERDAIAKIEG